MVKQIDARGLSCPSPVLLVKDLLDSNHTGPIQVMVDNEASNENVTRFLQSNGYQVEMEKREGDFYLQATAGEQEQQAEAPLILSATGESVKILVMIMVDRLGRGDDTLGEKLMINYIKTLNEMSGLWQIIFVNGGVKLVTEGSPVLEELQKYETDGITILACGTCLEHFKLTAEKRVGSSTNMLDIVTAMQLADKVITMS